MSQFVKYRLKNRWYAPRVVRKRPLGIPTNILRRPKVDKKYTNGMYVDEKYDLRDKEHIDEAEAIRGPSEKDFYQDHTYHSQWLQREMKGHQKGALVNQYRWMIPGFQVEPWLWYPGDQVEVVKGEFEGQRGTILNIVKYKNKVCIQNVNVQNIHIPATEDRAEQNIQREHPIDVEFVRHVDPASGEPCDVRMITVRNPDTGNLEDKRISMDSGTILPIPKDDALPDGDGLKDTPLVDAEEETYEHEKEIQIMAERKLQALEKHFVRQLKEAYTFHRDHAHANYEELQRYQRDTLERAQEMAVARIKQDPSIVKSWWLEGDDVDADEAAGLEGGGVDAQALAGEGRKQLH